MSAAITKVHPGTAGRIVLILALLVMSGCGFSLRGSQGQSGVPAMNLRAEQPESPFATLLQRELTDAGVDTADAASPAALTLELGPETLASRTLSLTSRASAAQYELSSSVSFTLRQSDEVIAGPETLTVQRTYFEDIANISGSSSEADLLHDEMRQELLTLLMRRLEAILSH